MKNYIFIAKNIGIQVGLKPKYMLWLFNMIIKPVLTYGSLVWWPKTEQTTIKNKLNRLQRLACLSISGAFKTTPTLAMEAIMNILPLHLHIKYEALKSAVRLRSLGLFFDNFTGGHRSILKLADTANKLLSAPGDRIIPQLIVEKRFIINICENRGWSGVWHFTRPPNCIHIFTDGSRRGNLSGAGIFCEQFSWEISINLGGHVTVFQAELHALYLSAKICNSKRIVDKTICIFTDSKSILQSLSRSATNSKSVLECVLELNALSINNIVHLIWIPAHQGIFGNERADEYAKRGAMYPPTGPEPFLPLASITVKQLLYEWALQKHKEIWESSDSCRQTKLLISQPLTNISKKLLNLSRSMLRALIGLITGHHPVNDHLSTMGLSNTRLCRFCDIDIESTYHLLCLCPKFVRSRQQAFGFDYLSSAMYSNVNIIDVLRFMKLESIILLQN